MKTPAAAAVWAQSACWRRDLLKVKPILVFRDGLVRDIGIVRGFDNAVSRVLELYSQRAEFAGEVYLFHAGPPALAQQCRERLLQIDPAARITVSWVGAVIGIYTGAGALGPGLCAEETAVSALFLALGAAAFGLMALSDALTVLYKRPWGGRLFAAGGALLALSTAGLLALRGLPRLRALGWWALAALALALLGYTLLAALHAGGSGAPAAAARRAAPRLSIPASMRCAATRRFVAGRVLPFCLAGRRGRGAAGGFCLIHGAGCAVCAVAGPCDLPGQHRALCRVPPQHPVPAAHGRQPAPLPGHAVSKIKRKTNRSEG